MKFWPKKITSDSTQQIPEEPIRFAPGELDGFDKGHKMAGEGIMKLQGRQEVEQNGAQRHVQTMRNMR